MNKSTKHNWSARSWRQYDAYAENWLRKNPLYAALLDSLPLQRLKGIGFLGAIGHFGNKLSDDSSCYLSRYSHSVGVAYLAALACENLSLQKSKVATIVAAALTHDVGHGALSHSIEPYFKRRFRVCHKHVGDRLLRGDLFLGNDLPEIFYDFGINPIDVEILIHNKTSVAGSDLFSGPINVDTIDGIFRAASFFSTQPQLCSPLSVLAAIVSPCVAKASFSDYFWKLKNSVYTEYIYDARWAVFDARVTLGLEYSKSTVTPDDFFLSDAIFVDHFRSGLARAEEEQSRLARYRHTETIDEIGEGQHKRYFYVDEQISLLERSCLSKRYQTVLRGKPHEVAGKLFSR